MTPKVITPPAVVLTLEQLRRHCKIDPPDAANEADDDLTAALAAAQPRPARTVVAQGRRNG